jgi:hypothetical protein
MCEEIKYIINKIKPDKFISLCHIKKLLCCSDYHAQKLMEYMIENNIATPAKPFNLCLVKR